MEWIVVVLYLVLAVFTIAIGSKQLSSWMAAAAAAFFAGSLVIQPDMAPFLVALAGISLVLAHVLWSAEQGQAEISLRLIMPCLVIAALAAIFYVFAIGLLVAGFGLDALAANDYLLIGIAATCLLLLGVATIRLAGFYRRITTRSWFDALAAVLIAVCVIAQQFAPVLVMVAGIVAATQFEFEGNAPRRLAVLACVIAIGMYVVELLAGPTSLLALLQTSSAAVAVLFGCATAIQPRASVPLSQPVLVSPHAASRAKPAGKAGKKPNMQWDLLSSGLIGFIGQVISALVGRR